MKILSKSNYVKGLQCSKLLWYSLNDRSVFPEIDKETQHKFDEGYLVGELARTLFPKGIDCSDKSNEENIRKTKEALERKKPLFEAGLSFQGLYARADILLPVRGRWDLVEVKSSTSVKEEHIPDVSYQYYVFSNAGIKIRKCYVMHINGEYVRRGRVNAKKLFTKEEIAVDTSGLKERAEEMLKIIESKSPPKKDIGPYCDDPYGCPLKEICWKHIPKNSVFELCGGKKCWELYDKGILKIKDIPQGTALNPKMQIQLETVKSGKPHIEKKAIEDFLKKLKYPLYYFDFETFSSAIPLFDGVKPYQQVPFQYSLHVVDRKTVHYSYLCLENRDPRPELLRTLKKQLGTKGSIIAYNAGFEIGRLNEMAKAYPKYRRWIKSLIPRFVDLLEPFAKFQCYYPSQGKTASLKAVLPAFTGKDYSRLEIGDGGEATLAYFEVTQGIIKDKTEIETTRKHLEAYCCLDTEGMIWIVERLEEMRRK